MLFQGLARFDRLWMPFPRARGGCQLCSDLAGFGKAQSQCCQGEMYLVYGILLGSGVYVILLNHCKYLTGCDFHVKSDVKYVCFT